MTEIDKQCFQEIFPDLRTPCFESQGICDSPTCDVVSKLAETPEIPKDNNLIKIAIHMSCKNSLIR